MFLMHSSNDTWIGIHNYELYGVVSHSGGMKGGHYVSYVSRYIEGVKRWFYISDSHVSEIKEEKLQQVEAYLLFYVKLN